MNPLRKTAALLSLGLGLFLSSCAAHGPKPLVDPFPVRFPLVVAGELPINGRIAGQPWAENGIVHYRTTDGTLTAVVASSRIVLSRTSAGPADPERPVRAGSLILRRDSDTLRAIDAQGQTAWEFKAKGALSAEPVVAGRRILVGDAERMLYCLNARNGKVKWRRRLQGVPLHPAVAAGKAVAVAASNSVVYRLALGGGSILSWEAVPSRVLYPLAETGAAVLVSSDSPTVDVLDMKTGKKAEPLKAPGTLVAGAVPSPPYVAIFVVDEASGGQKIVFFRSR